MARRNTNPGDLLRLTVLNTDDEKPQFLESDYTISIAEDAETGRPLAAILAGDADGDPIKYSITSGDSGGIFQINPTTGILSLKSSIKGNPRTQYTLQVKASNSAQDSRFDEVRVVVNIEDSNDNRPEFIDCPPSEVPVEREQAKRTQGLLRSSLRILRTGEETKRLSIFSLPVEKGCLRLITLPEL